MELGRTMVSGVIRADESDPENERIEVRETVKQIFRSGEGSNNMSDRFKLFGFGPFVGLTLNFFSCFCRPRGCRVRRRICRLLGLSFGLLLLIAPPEKGPLGTPQGVVQPGGDARLLLLGGRRRCSGLARGLAQGEAFQRISRKELKDFGG